MKVMVEWKDDSGLDHVQIFDSWTQYNGWMASPAGAAAIMAGAHDLRETELKTGLEQS